MGQKVTHPKEKIRKGKKKSSAANKFISDNSGTEDYGNENSTDSETDRNTKDNSTRRVKVIEHNLG